MRLRALLLRLLLCIAFVANGTSAVHASTSMVSGMASTSAASQSSDASCHDMPAMTHAAMTVDDGTPMTPSSPSHADCCPPGACLCSCVSHASTLPSVQALAMHPEPSAVPVAALRVSFASPALPNLLRPPIG